MADVSTPQTETIFTLPQLSESHRKGLIAIVVVASTSLVSVLLLFSHLTIKLLRWHVRSWRRKRAGRDAHHRPPTVDLSLGLAPEHFQSRRQGTVVTEGQLRRGDVEQGGSAVTQQATAGHGREPNQFVVLLYNLLLADLHQSVAFGLNVAWLRENAIVVGTPTCWAQGFFVSNGDLAISLFITAIAVHTYLVTIHGWRPSQKALILSCVSLWMFTYLMTAIGILGTANGAAVGGFYVRAKAWCWINRSLGTVRLLTHYVYIFISLVVTSGFYIAIVLHLCMRRRRRAEGDENISNSGNSFTSQKHNTAGASEATNTPYSSAFIIYPVAYVLCISPLAIGRVLTIAGREVSATYLCAAGVLISANGLLDVLIWGFTQRDVVFGDVDETADVLGLDSFSFMRTPRDRKYGNIIVVEGASGRHRGSLTSDDRPGRGRNRTWWKGRYVSHKGGMGRKGRLRGTTSQECLRGGIQMEMVTTVVVEEDVDARGGLFVRPEEYVALAGSAALDTQASGASQDESETCFYTGAGDMGRRRDSKNHSHAELHRATSTRSRI